MLYSMKQSFYWWQHLRICSASARAPAAAIEQAQQPGALPCAGFSVGQPVAELAYGAFSEWAIVPAKHALAVPVLAPEIVALLTSGLTASIGAPAHAKLQSVSTPCLHSAPCDM